jgi:hypothetical protein
MSFFDPILNNLSSFNFTSMDYFTLTLNLILFVFAKHLIVKRDNLNHEIKDYSLKVKILRSISFFFLAAFFASMFFVKSISANWVQTYLLIVFCYIANHWLNHFFVEKYGNRSKVDDVERITDNYISSMLTLASSITFIIFAILSVIHIWELKSWLENGSVLLSIGIFIYSTKEFWLYEVLSSFTIHAQGKFKRGSVIRIDNEIFVILETRYLGTRLKNHKTDIEVRIPNKKLIDEPVELLSIEKSNGNTNEKTEYKNTRAFIVFNIGYTTNNIETIYEYFNKVMEESIKVCPLIGSKHVVEVVNNGDHAVQWELMYYVGSPFQHRNAHNIINTKAFSLQGEFGICLSTPTTYTKIQ